MTPEQIVHKMMEKDAYSRWLGIQVLKIKEGYCELQMKVQADQMNGFQIAHGGITYALSDSALAFASNGYGKHCVSIETSIAHMRPVQLGDLLTATCKEINRSRTLGLYEVKVNNQEGKLVSFFTGQVKLLDKEWE